MRFHWKTPHLIGVMLLLLSSGIFAWIPPDCDRLHLFRLVNESNWTAFVERQNGVETLTIPFARPVRPHSAFIIPIPATPASTSACWVDTLPDCIGRTPLSTLHGNVDDFFYRILYTQIYSVILLSEPTHAYTDDFIPKTKPQFIFRKLQSSDATDFSAQLTAAGLNFQSDSLPAPLVFKKTETFLLVTPASENDLDTSDRPGFPGFYDSGLMPSLQIKFPSPKTTLPQCLALPAPQLSPQATICFTGHLTPDQPLDPTTKFQHFTGTLTDRPSILPTGATVYGRYETGTPYTRLQGPVPDHEITFSLSQDDSLPIIDYFSNLLVHRVTWYAIFFASMAILSYFSAGLAGLIIARQWNPYATLGLFNLLTLAALAIRVYTLKPTNSLHTPKHKGRFLIAFSIIFVCATVGIRWIFDQQLGPYSPGWGGV